MTMLRQTILNNYERCPYMCYKEFGTLEEPKDRHDEEERYSNKYAAAGIALHEAMEWWGNEKINGTSRTLIEVHDKLDERFELIPHDLFKDDNDRKTFYNSLHEQINWIYEHSHLIVPIKCELNFTIENLFDDIDVGFTGTIDRIDGDIANQDVDLVDYKTGKTYTKKELSTNMQACIYAEAFKKMYGFYPKRFVFMFSKARRLKVVHINPEFMANAKARIKGLYMRMVSGEYKPDSSNKYFCKNFCEYYKECPAHKKGGWNVDFEVFNPDENV